MRLAQAALTDSLTGLGNHRSFHEDLERELARRARSGSCFSIVMLDLDGLKQINDTLGHQAGDARLRALGECLRATMRANDSAYRIGGDELMVLLPDERAWGAFMFAQRLQREGLSNRTGVTFTCGIAESTASRAPRRSFATSTSPSTKPSVPVAGSSSTADGLAPKPAAPPEERANRHHQRLLATALARAVDAKDQGTRNHCETVSELCVLIGEELGLDADRLERIRLAGLLHDVGKIGVADRILRKPGRRTPTRPPRCADTFTSAIRSSRPPSSRRKRDGCSITTSTSTAAATPTASEATRSRSSRASSSSPTRSRRSPPSGRTAHFLGKDALAELDAHAGAQFDAACVEALRSALGRNLSKTSQVEAA